MEKYFEEVHNFVGGRNSEFMLTRNGVSVCCFAMNWCNIDLTIFQRGYFVEKIICAAFWCVLIYIANGLQSMVLFSYFINIFLFHYLSLFAALANVLDAIFNDLFSQWRKYIKYLNIHGRNLSLEIVTK